MEHWPLGPDRWHEPVPRWERRLLGSLPGPVLDVGCGPGRHVAALASVGTRGIGIDTCPLAISRLRHRGHEGHHGSVWDDLPDEGTWGSALLLDENLGLGADPVRLLQRLANLLHRSGRVVVEAIPWISGVQRVDVGQPWANIGPDAISSIASAASFDVLRTVQRDGRHLSLLVRT